LRSGESIFDVDMMDNLVGILDMNSGTPVLLAYACSNLNGALLTAIG
jgi:hypothetical protein